MWTQGQVNWSHDSQCGEHSVAQDTICPGPIKSCLAAFQSHLDANGDISPTKAGHTTTHMPATSELAFSHPGNSFLHNSLQPLGGTLPQAHITTPIPLPLGVYFIPALYPAQKHLRGIEGGIYCQATLRQHLVPSGPWTQSTPVTSGYYSCSYRGSGTKSLSGAVHFLLLLHLSSWVKNP